MANMWGRGVIAGASLLLLGGCGLFASAPKKPGYDQHWPKAPAMTINTNAQYKAKIVTSLGTIVLQLFAKQDPKSANNFVFLARHHYYNGDKIFRVIKNFMFQTGSPQQNGLGGPGYEFSGRLPPPYAYTPGIVAYANAGPTTNGSQFFICSGSECGSIGDTYPEIGRVISGMNVVQKITDVKVKANPIMNGEVSLPTTSIFVKSITIEGPTKA